MAASTSVLHGLRAALLGFAERMVPAAPRPKSLAAIQARRRSRSSWFAAEAGGRPASQQAGRVSSPHDLGRCQGAQAGGITQFRIRTPDQKQFDDCRPIEHCGQDQRCPPTIGPAIRGGTVLKQQAHHLQVALEGRASQWRLTAIIGKPGVCPG
jgi:hypothetical protein